MGEYCLTLLRLGPVLIGSLVHRNPRIETLMTYAQSVYLLFASVYVCKETVEHLLLSSGEGEHHHHHHGEGSSRITG